jgi:hypothetical protein
MGTELPSPESRVPSPEPRVPSPESRAASREPRAASREPRKSDPEQRPLPQPRHVMQAAIFERQAGVADDVADGAGDEGLAG